MSEADTTRMLSKWIAGVPVVPAEVRRESVRSFVNWLGCSLGGVEQAAAVRAYATLSRFAGIGHATVIGRSGRTDALTAAFLNGIASHIDDFDDTHLRTIIHPAGPVVAAVLAVGELVGASGESVVSALAIGMEVECRLGNAVSPEHYDQGWHITATAGVFGAAAGVSRLLNLNAEQTGFALGLAATQSSGLRAMFGSMAKSFHVGHAARCGALSALLAKSGFDASEEGIEGTYGFLKVMSPRHDLGEIVDGLGSRWEVLQNSYKPFACAIVLHPVIDACIQIRSAIPAFDDIKFMHVKANPLVLRLCGKTDPRSGIEGKASVYHAAAVALLRGDGSPSAYTDTATLEPSVVKLRQLVEVESDAGFDRDAAEVVITLMNGQTHRCYIEHAIGSNKRPLSDADLEMKFRNQAVSQLGESRSETLLQLAWRIDTLGTLASLTENTVLPGQM